MQFCGGTHSWQERYKSCTDQSCASRPQSEYCARPVSKVLSHGYDVVGDGCSKFCKYSCRQRGTDVWHGSEWNVFKPEQAASGQWAVSHGFIWGQQGWSEPDVDETERRGCKCTAANDATGYHDELASEHDELEYGSNPGLSINCPML